MWHVYIVRCSDNSFYTGVTTDLENRIKRHNSSSGAQYTKIKKPVTLIYWEDFVDKNQALIREIQIKKLSKINKEKLINCWAKQVSLAPNET